MPSGEESSIAEPVSGRLIHDIYTRVPLIEQFVTHCGLPEVTSESLIFATFGKTWHVEVQNFEAAGRYRDVQRDALEKLVTERDLAMANVLESLVGQMFEVSSSRKNK